MQQAMSFQGQSIRVRRESKNRYEFRSPYTVQFGTATEIERLLQEHMASARNSAIEAAHARAVLKKIAAEDGTLLEAGPAPVTPVTPAAPPTPVPVTVDAPLPPVPMRTPIPRRKREHTVMVVARDTTKAKPRPNSLAYLRQLMAQAE